MLEFAFMRLAFVASAAAGVALGIMGVYLVLRRVVFQGLVLANAATVGAAIGEIFGWSPEIAGVVTSVGAALALGAIPPPRRISPESIMGWAYAAAAAATILILAGAARADTDTLHLLYGNVLAVSPSHTAGLALVATAIAVVHGLFARRFLLITFDVEGAQVAGIPTRAWTLFLSLCIGVATAAAVHEVGVLLTFSLLTLAPTSSLLVARTIRATFLTSAAIGVVAVSLGLVAAWFLDLPPGPLSVALLVVAVVAAGILGSAPFRRMSPAPRRSPLPPPRSSARSEPPGASSADR